MTKIGSSRIEIGTYFAAMASMGAMIRVGSSMREMSDAISNLVPIWFSSESAARACWGRVFLALFVMLAGDLGSGTIKGARILTDWPREQLESMGRLHLQTVQ
jgi:hypothetical protein